MKYEIAVELKKAAEELARFFSQPERKAMFTGEDWTLDDIFPLSDTAAAVVYLKTGGKKAVAFFFYDGTGNKKSWKKFFPSDSHIVGMEAFSKYKLEIEHSNFGFNFIHRDPGGEG